MSYLFVVAHPDDEVLGGGATIQKLVANNEEVNVCIICGNAEARTYRPCDDELKADIVKSQKSLGVKRVKAGSFHDSNLNVYPHNDIVRFIENCIIEFTPTSIITHHPSDLNADHHVTSVCCMEASRLPQRKTANIPPLRQLMFMEVLSSTEWAMDTSIHPFRPNLFVEVGSDYLDKKIQALSQYRGVMREYPHPRSQECIRSLSVFRGCQSGTMYAEAFEVAFRIGL